MRNGKLIERIKFEVNDLVAHKREDLMDIIGKTDLNKKDIKFILVGANDGIVNDPVAPFIDRYGWEGLFVEPIKKYFSELEANYGSNKKIILENVALGEEECQKEMYFVSGEAPFLTRKLGKRLASFHKEIITNHSWYIPKIKDNIDSEKVEVKTLDQLLDKHNYWDANVFVIDVEGHELEIIKTIDFNKFEPKIIYFETKHLERYDKWKIEEIIKNYAYETFDLGRDSYGILKQSIKIN